MMRYIECPTWYDGPEHNKVFMAGGITGCPNWQAELREWLLELRLDRATLLNPRRKIFPGGEAAVREQIKWEFAHLSRANAISFWFPAETVCPITLFELGKWLTHPSEKPIFVGMHPEYSRRLDLEIQVPLQRGDIPICYSIRELAGRIHKWCLDQGELK